MSKHTPGPWDATWGSEGSFDVNSTANKWSAVAEVSANKLGSREVSFDEAAANARLIAAAPDLLAACEAILLLPVAVEKLRTLDRGIGTATPDSAWLAVRAAIAKAKETK